ncbi:hypothetical protein GBAR_LOCUS9357 [Geodia barretti]|uniref:Uncharacterized protein n=1 Tax=Geodia barretti TaxID=519541 RepID=A0AA35RNW0_GEOBA|nr:hypothetical protein GBAR_LOCUS9357 [Geodia barretti]
MGCGSSMPVVPGEDVPTKTVYLSVKGESKSVAFSSDCTSQEVREVLKSAAKLNRTPQNMLAVFY